MERRPGGGAVLEISAPGPTFDGSYNTFNNPNGTERDADGHDTGSVIYRKLPAAAGSETLSALALGLATSLSYDVRILPTASSGAVDGQASPTSLLEVDDGLAPDGSVVDTFAIAGTISVVSVTGPDGSRVLSYNPATGSYGSVIASDTYGGQYYVFGVDPSAHTALVDDVTTAGNGSTTDHLQLYNTHTGRLVGTLRLSGYRLTGGVVDAARHRADLLAIRVSSGDDTVIAVSMVTGVVQRATDADGSTVSPGTLENIAVDQATGEVYATAAVSSLLCIGGGTSIAEVNPGTGKVRIAPGGTQCDTDLAVDTAARELLSVTYRAVSFNFAGTSSLVVIPEAHPSRDSVHPLRNGEPLELAADPLHHLALILYALPAGPAQFGAPQGIAVSDSNAMSVIELINTRNGKIIRTIADFNSPSVNEYPFASGPGIQLDPAARTGYTFAPGDDQVQQFSY